MCFHGAPETILERPTLRTCGKLMRFDHSFLSARDFKTFGFKKKRVRPQLGHKQFFFFFSESLPIQTAFSVAK
jgi:hypothetical protein